MATAAAETDLDWTVVRSLRASPRVERLHERFLARYSELSGRSHRYWEDDDVQAWTQAVLKAYRETDGQEPILRRSRALVEYAEAAPVRVTEDDLLVGLQTFNCPGGGNPEARQELRELGYANTTGHIVHDYEGLLADGVGGYLGKIAERRRRNGAPGAHRNLDAFAEAIWAFRRFIQRHAEQAESVAADATSARACGKHRLAEDLRSLMDDPPRHFRQALQFVWFMQIFLHAENPSAAISFGRADQYLWPFLERDLGSGEIGLPEAYDLVCAFFIKCCEGEESQNLLLGGVDTEGMDASNPLSLLFLAAMKEMRTFQPSLCVRFHPKAHPEFVRAACELSVAGSGQPGFINDVPAIKGLRELGIPVERARDYAIVGCYEASPQGDTYPNTVAGSLHLVSLMAGYLDSDASRKALTFEAFLDGWVDFVRDCYEASLAGEWQRKWSHWRDEAPSPFGSVFMKGCIESASPLEAGGARFSLFGINILGLGTVVDSLHAIRELAFVREELCLADLAEATASDFPDEALRQRLRSLPGRYGTDSGGTNRLAAEVSARIAQMVIESRMDAGVRPYPGFFKFTADIFEHPCASPDGRRSQELVSYGAGPSAAVATTPTAVMASASHVAHDRCACGNPLAITLQRSDVGDGAGVERIRSLVQAYFAAGGFHVHFNVMSADELREAKANPSAHESLIVRISGYSARFTTLREEIQDALIERAERGT